MQTARTEPAEPTEHAETARRWVHSMIEGSAGLPASQVGGKAWNLARLADAGALVPPWVVIPAWVFDRFAAAAVSSRGGAADCASALQILQATPLPARLTTAVLAALDTAGVHGEVAVDLAQDLLDNSDAGLETYVRVGDSLGRALKFLGAGEVDSQVIPTPT